MSETGRFVLLSSFKNEAEHLGKCLGSIASQSCLPLAWVMVDDGSTDQSTSIVESFLPRCPFIRLIRLPPRSARSFDAKDRAINQAYATIRTLDFDFVGIQDPDTSLESSDYFRDVLTAFSSDQKLAITGGVVCEVRRGRFQERVTNVPWSVPGCVQMFRRRCYDLVGGFVPLECGGSDTLMELEMRRRGYTTRTVPHLRVFHHRPTSSAGGVLRGYFRLGHMDAAFGSHPLFMFLKFLSRLPQRPLLAGAVMIYAGYLAHHLRRRPRQVPAEVTQHLRKEQLRRSFHRGRLEPTS